MTATTMTSREFNQDTSRAKRAAESGPVFITDRGPPHSRVLHRHVDLSDADAPAPSPALDANDSTCHRAA